MKKLLLLLVASLTMLFWGCTQFDDSRIWDAIDELEDLYDDLDGRVEDLEEACEKMNTNIEALQTLVSALQNNDTISSIAPIKQGDKVVGYTITFSMSEPITIYHGNDGKDGANGADGQDGANGADGKDGKDGYTPQIGVAKDSDNVYYWTLDGEWLLDESGNKIKAVGTDGKDGEDGADGANGSDGEDGKDGENGADGKDGEDGITPQLEIREGYWWISYDNGATWKELGKATGEDGKDGADGEDGKDGADGANGSDGQDGKDGADGDSLFESVTWDEEYAYFTLSDGTVIKIPLSREAVKEPIEIIAKYYWAEYDGGWDDIHAYEIKLTDTYNFLEEKFDNEESNCNFYHIGICTNEEPATGVLPNGTYVLSTTYEAGTLSGVEGGECYIVRNNEWEEVYATDAVLVISDNKIDGTFTLENGEVHHVVYEGSLKLYEEGGEEEDTPTPPANEIWYTSTDGEVVTPYNADEFGANIVSNTYENGKGVITFDGDVTSIGGYYAFYYCSSLASVSIGNGVTSIGIYAFYGCESLASVTIPESVTEIGEGAFVLCSSLASITIPESVTSIGTSAFYECSSLTSITIPDSVTEIGRDAFYGCSSLTSITIPDSVTEIRDYAFYECSSLTSITIPNGVTSIGDCAFSECSRLASVTIPDSVTTIGSNAFNRCSSLASVTIPDGVTEIGGYAFNRCSSLTSVTLPDNLTTLGSAVFGGCTSLSSFNGKFATDDGKCLIIDNILNAFAVGCGLTEYTIPDSVTSIGDQAFDACISLESINIPDSVTSIGMEAFRKCSSLASITIPDGVTSIGHGAFYGCSMIESVIIPDNVTNVGGQAFQNCSSLMSVYCKPTTPPTGGFYGGYLMFDGNASERMIYVPTESVESYKTADWWSDYAYYIVGYDFE